MSDLVQRVAANSILVRPRKETAYERPTWEEYFLQIAKDVSSRGTCRRRRVGCVLVDSRNRIIGTGYNGVAHGLPHCLDVPCDGAEMPSGQGLDDCGAIHAECNSVAVCRDVFEIKTCYLTTAPCINCVKLLLGTSCERIVYAEEYPHIKSKLLWENAGRKWERYEKPI